MKYFKILCALIALSITLSAQLASAKDNEFEFVVKGFISKKIDNQDDYVLYEAAKYAKKKGYEFFEVLNVRRYDKTRSSRKMNRIGSKTSTRPRLRTEMVIHCFDAGTGKEGIYNTKTTLSEINEKYFN